jgi:phosphoribosylamine--glycine ligase
MKATARGELDKTEVKFSNKSACCVILASKGYPVKYQSGFQLTLPETDAESEIFVAGAKLEDGKLLSAGGRVLGVTDVATDLKSAIDGAYKKVSMIKFDNAFYRSDIGQKALKATEVK